MKIRVPGNMLLAGEYCITREAGFGLSMAVDRYVRVDFEPSTGLTITTSLFNSTASPDSTATTDPMISFLVDWWRQKVGLVTGNIYIDSLMLFDSQGNKMGLGSSAAVTVGLFAAFSVLSQRTSLRTGDFAKDDDLAQWAIQAHRSFQQGIGSGYDILTSFYGGTGTFLGGIIPKYTPIILPWMQEVSMHLLLGRLKVSSAEAVQQFNLWAADHPQETDRLMLESYEILQQILSSRSWQDVYPQWILIRDLYSQLGTRIDVPADSYAVLQSIFPPLQDTIPHRVSNHFFSKCLGAGDELVLILQRKDHSAIQDPMATVDGAGLGKQSSRFLSINKADHGVEVVEC